MVTVSDCRLEQSEAHAALGSALVFATPPHSIKKMIKKECFIGNDWLQQKEFFDYFVVGGNWDQDYSFVSEDRNFVEMKELISVRDGFRSSSAYKQCVEELQIGCPQKGIDGNYFTSIDDVDEAFIYYLDLIRSMETVGYLPILTSRKKTESHIGVGISREGELFHFRTGHHRLAIASLLNLNSVIAQVHCVHSQWADAAVLEYGGTEIDAIRSAIKHHLVKEKESG